MLQTSDSGPCRFQECSGECALNGDLTNAIPWAVTSNPVLGRVIYDPTSNSIQICTVSAAAAASKPTFSATAGVVTDDSANRWTSLGLASAWSSTGLRRWLGYPSATIANAGAAGNDFLRRRQFERNDDGGCRPQHRLDDAAVAHNER